MNMLIAWLLFNVKRAVFQLLCIFITRTITVWTGNEKPKIERQSIQWPQRSTQIMVVKALQQKLNFEPHEPSFLVHYLSPGFSISNTTSNTSEARTAYPSDIWVHPPFYFALHTISDLKRLLQPMIMKHSKLLSLLYNTSLWNL